MSRRLGHPCQTLGFETRERARLEAERLARVAVDRWHRHASVDEVLRVLSRAMDAHQVARESTRSGQGSSRGQ